MSNKVKDIDIKKPRTLLFQRYYQYKNCKANNTKIDEKSYKSILIYYIEYVTIKEYVKIYSANPLYLIFSNINEYLEVINKSKYLSLIPTNETREKTENMKNCGVKLEI